LPEGYKPGFFSNESEKNIKYPRMEFTPKDENIAPESEVSRLRIPMAIFISAKKAQISKRVFTRKLCGFVPWWYEFLRFQVIPL
jgi:hypothetical protein